MKTQTQFRKTSVRISKSGSVIIIKDELGATILLNTNLVKHALGIPFVKKDGTTKNVEQIQADKARAQTAYLSAIVQGN